MVRRRIGKTRLVMEWVRDKPHVYMQCLPASDDVNLSRLSRAIGDQFGLDIFYKVESCFLIVGLSRSL